jgi:hypothetical protein
MQVLIDENQYIRKKWLLLFIRQISKNSYETSQEKIFEVETCYSKRFQIILHKNFEYLKNELCSPAPPSISEKPLQLQKPLKNEHLETEQINRKLDI